MQRNGPSRLRGAALSVPFVLAALLFLASGGAPAGAEATGAEATGPEATGAEAARAARIGLTLSTSTFFPLGTGEYLPLPAGLYGRAGIAWLPGNHLELELYHIPQITPELYSRVFFGLSAGWWLLERKQTGYFNMVVDAGALYGLDGTWLLALRLSPLVLGGPQYRTAERALSVGLLLDPRRLRLLFQLQVIAITFYL